MGAMAHVEVGLGEALGGGEDKGGGAPYGADGQELCQGGLEEVVVSLVHLGGWRQSGWLGGPVLGDRPHRQG